MTSVRASVPSTGRGGQILRHAQKHAASISTLAGVGIAAWIFQIYQSQIDQQETLNKELYRFIAPGLLALCIIVVTALIATVATRPTLRHPIPDFPTALLAYAERLRAEGRNRAVLRLRRDESLTLHILGRHKERIRLGQLALGAAAVLDRDIDRAAILVDDLGWANFLTNDHQTAIDNITRGVNVANAYRESLEVNSDEIVGATIVQARGSRHLVLIEAAEGSKDINQVLPRLTDADALLQQLVPATAPEIRRERAQLDHAYALAIAMHLRINKDGYVSPTDATGRAFVAEALVRLQKAVLVFDQIDDEARLAKSLLLKVRLLTATGDTIAASEAQAKANAAVEHSAWIEEGGIQNILGPQK